MSPSLLSQKEKSIFILLTSSKTLTSSRTVVPLPVPKFKVKMTWLDTYEQVVEAPTKEDAIAEADGGDWGEPLWGGDEVETTAEEIQ